MNKSESIHILCLRLVPTIVCYDTDTSPDQNPLRQFVLYSPCAPLSRFATCLSPLGVGNSCRRRLHNALLAIRVPNSADAVDALGATVLATPHVDVAPGVVGA